MEKLKGLLGVGKNKSKSDVGGAASRSASSPSNSNSSAAPPLATEAAKQKNPNAPVKLPKDLPKAETGERARLLAALLSPESRTDVAEEKAAEDSEAVALEVAEVVTLLQKYVEGVDAMMDRTGSLPVSQLVTMTYSGGLPIYKNNAAVQQHTIHAMHAIFREVAFGKSSEEAKKKLLTRLIDAFKACQAEQGRVIDSIYGTISGRDKTFRDQVLGVVDVMKELTLENVVNTLNPDAWKVPDDYPQKQVPHITSSYRIALGRELGLRGVEAAQMDHCAFVLSEADREVVRETFVRMFDLDQLAKTLVSDVNQQSKDADRLVNRDLLGKWAGDKDENNGFNSHSIFFDEDNKKLYEDFGTQPEEENMYQPFLHPAVAMEMLMCLFVR